MSSPANHEVESPSSPDLVGATLAGKYRVKRRIGAGGMGAVYEGEHIEIGKRVAIKVIDHEHASSEQLSARFRREARAASAVESEHIVQVFDVGHDPVAGLYMVMEFLSGEDLSSHLERGSGKLPVEEAVTIVAQAARGLAKAHGAGVVHRDLKPANLFLTRREDGSMCVKVVDFGISKLQRRENEPTQTLTREGSVVGTPVYMSPEQAQGLTVDARTDIWALGALTYELLAGRPPYALLTTYEQMIIQIVTQPIPKLSEVAPWVPDEVCAVVEAALRHDLSQRTADATTFARDLLEAADLMQLPPSSPHIAVLGSSPKLPNAHARTVPDPDSDAKLANQATSTLHDDQPRGVPKDNRSLIAIGLAALVGLIGAGVLVFALSSKGTPAPASPTPTRSAIASAVSAAPPAPPVSVVAATAPAESVSAGTTASTAPVGSARPRPPSLPSTGRAVPAPAAKPQPQAPQYGAAGVTTAY